MDISQQDGTAPVVPPDSRPAVETPSFLRRNALLVALLATAGIIAAACVVLLAGIQTRAWQQLAVALLFGGYAVVAGVGSWWCWQRRPVAGIQLILSGALVMMLISVALVPDVGLVLGLSLIIVIIIAVGHDLPQGEGGRIALVCLGVGVAAVLINTLWTPGRPHIPDNFTVLLPAVIVLVILIVVFFVVQQFARYSLRTKIGIAFLFIVILPLILLGFLDYYVARLTLIADTGADLQATARAQALLVGDHLAQRINDLQSLGTNPVLLEQVKGANLVYPTDPVAVQSEIERFEQQWRIAIATDNDLDPLLQSRLNNELALQLQAYRDFFPDVVQMVVTDRYGALVAATSRMSDYCQATTGWWQGVFSRQPAGVYAGQPEAYPGSTLLVQTIAVPLYAANTRTVVGVLGATYRLTSLVEMLQRPWLNVMSQAELYLAGGYKLSANGDKVVPADPNILATIQAQTTARYVETTYEGMSRLISWSPVTVMDRDKAAAIAPLGWMVVAHQEMQKGLGLLDDLRGNVVILVLALIAVEAIAGWGIMQFLIGPIQRLIVVTERVTLGHLAVQVPVETQDEIGALAAAFNTMITQLRQTLEGLEQRVAERTSQLESLHQMSLAITAELDVEALLRAITQRAMELMGGAASGFFLYRPDRDVLERRVSVGACVQPVGTIFRRGEGLPGRILETGEPLVVNRHCQPGEQWIAGEGDLTRSVIGIPIRWGENFLGVLNVIKEGTYTFSPTDLQLLSLFGAQAAIALANAQLYERAQREIVERSRAEEQIRASLAEKEVLLKEIHHRVKNNLQVVSSLLNLQAQSASLTTSLEVLQESQNRIRSMALIHEMLYRSQDLAQVDFADYARDLTAFLFRSYPVYAQAVMSQIDIAEDVRLGIDVAIPCGLILNELISNALKHAFPAHRDRAANHQDRIWIEMKPHGEQWCLIVSDNGIGFPPELDFRQTESLGLQLVQVLVAQLRGSIEMERQARDGGRGTTFRVILAST